MQHHLTRYELLLAVCALTCAVAGFIVLTQPSRPAAHRLRPVAQAPSPSPAASPQLIAPSPAAPIPSPQAAVSPAPPSSTLAVTGPAALSPWRMSTFVVAFQSEGAHSVTLWWTGAAMARWAWARVDGHSVLQSAGQDQLTWQVNGPGTVELYLTPSGAPGGHLVIQGRDGSGQTIDLATADVPDWAG